MCRGLLTTGLGRIGLGAKKAPPQPHDYRTVFIFVVGGVSMADLRSMGEMLQAGGQAGGVRFVLGGTGLVGPGDVCRHALGW